MAIGKITSKSLAADAVTSANLAPGAVTINDIPDSEITADKLHTTLDLSTKTLTLTQASVTAHQSALSVTQSQISDLSTTTDLTEGTNLYYTDARADARAALLVDSAPATLDTLNELAAALGDDPNFATTVSTQIGTKLNSTDFTKTNIDALNIDAATVDGLDSTQFLRSDTNSDFTSGYIRFYDSNIERGRLYANGNLVLGTTTPTYEIEIRDNAGNPLVNIDRTNGRVGINGPAYFPLNVTNDVDGVISRWRKDGGTNNPLLEIELSEANSAAYIVQSGSNTGDLGFKIGADIKMMLKNNGNVGIGTNAPTSKLHIESTSAWGATLEVNQKTPGTSGAQLFLKHESTSPADGDYLGFLHYKGMNSAAQEVQYARIHATSADVTDGSEDGSLFLMTAQGGIENSNGIAIVGSNVGIGTTSPQAKLHVTSSVLIEGGSTDSRTLGFTNASGSTGWSIGNGIIDSTHNFRIYDNTAGAARVTVDGSGNVGIGTTSPTAHLEISAGAPTLILNANSQPSGKKKVRLAASQVTAGDFHIQSMADNGTTVNSTPFLIDTNGITRPDKLQPSTYEPNIKYTQVTGGFNGSGGTQATSNTWYPITNQNMNNYNSDYSGGDRGINFMIKWTSGNVNRGYHHTVTGHIPILSANSYISYQNATYSTQASGTSMSEGLNLNISHHTGCVSGHNIQCRLYGDGSNYGAIYLQIRAEATPQNGDAYISFWKV